MRAYSHDLRERLVQAVAEGQPMSAGARRFVVSTMTVKHLIQLQQQTGNVTPRPIPGGVRRIGPDQEAALRVRLATEPDATVLEHCAWWAAHHGEVLSEVPMWRALRRLGWTHKKNRSQQAKDMRTSAPPGAPKSPRPTHAAWCLSTNAAPTPP